MACLLITGSRDGHPHFIEVANAWVQFNGPPAWVFLGDEPNGVDRQAYDWCVANGYSFTVCVALWKRFGRKAGPLRNQDMNNQARWSNPDVVGFPIGPSPGTRGCMRISRSMGFRIVEVGS